MPAPNELPKAKVESPRKTLKRPAMADANQDENNEVVEKDTLGGICWYDDKGVTSPTKRRVSHKAPPQLRRSKSSENFGDEQKEALSDTSVEVDDIDGEAVGDDELRANTGGNDADFEVALERSRVEHAAALATMEGTFEEFSPVYAGLPFEFMGMGYGSSSSVPSRGKINIVYVLLLRLVGLFVFMGSSAGAMRSLHMPLGRASCSFRSIELGVRRAAMSRSSPGSSSDDSSYSDEEGSSSSTEVCKSNRHVSRDEAARIAIDGVTSSTPTPRLAPLPSDWAEQCMHTGYEPYTVPTIMPPEHVPVTPSQGSMGVGSISVDALAPNLETQGLVAMADHMHDRSFETALRTFRIHPPENMPTEMVAQLMKVTQQFDGGEIEQTKLLVELAKQSGIKPAGQELATFSKKTEKLMLLRDELQRVREKGGFGSKGGSCKEW